MTAVTRLQRKSNAIVYGMQYDGRNVNDIINFYYNPHHKEVTLDLKTRALHGVDAEGTATTIPLNYWVVRDLDVVRVYSPEKFRRHYDVFVDPDADVPPPAGYLKVDMQTGRTTDADGKRVVLNETTDVKTFLDRFD